MPASAKSVLFPLGMAVVLAATGCTPFLLMPDEVKKTREDLTVHIQEERAVAATLQGGGDGQMNSSIAELRANVDQLREQMAALNSQMEDLVSMVGDMSRQVKSMGGPARPAPARPPVEDPGLLSAPLPPTSGLTTPSPANPPPASSSAPAAAGRDPVALYNDAYRKFTAGDMDSAIEGFRSLVDLFPDSDLADNSLFWIGESHVQKNRLAEAEKAFAETVSRFPNGNKVPDALFKLGYTQSMLNKQDQATATWRDLISKFPNEPAALKAKQELQDLGR